MTADEFAAFLHVMNRCAESGDDPTRWNKEHKEGAWIVTQWMTHPPRVAPSELRAHMDRLLELYGVGDWPREPHARQALLQRLRTRIDAERWFDDPKHELIPAPIAVEHWEALIDHWLAMMRHGRKPT